MEGRKKIRRFLFSLPADSPPPPRSLGLASFPPLFGKFRHGAFASKNICATKENACTAGFVSCFFYDGSCNVTVGYICRCFGGYDGPNCELTTRSFEPGEWIWLPPPQQCTVGSLSLEFASREANGLLLYGGPTSPVGNGDVYDFITVELSGGKILVSMSLGDRDDVVRLGVTSGMALNDGEWHHVEVFRDKTVNTFLLFLLFFGGVYLTFYLDSAVFVTQSLVKATK